MEFTTILHGRVSVPVVCGILEQLQSVEADLEFDDF